MTEAVWIGSFVNSNDKPPSLKQVPPRERDYAVSEKIISFAGYSSFNDKTRDVPSSPIVTPYITLAASIVARL